MLEPSKFLQYDKRDRTTTEEAHGRDSNSVFFTTNEGSNPTDCEGKMASYVSSRKDVIKRDKRFIQSLKQLVDDDGFGSSSLFQKDIGSPQ